MGLSNIFALEPSLRQAAGEMVADGFKFSMAKAPIQNGGHGGARLFCYQHSWGPCRENNTGWLVMKCRTNGIFAEGGGLVVLSAPPTMTPKKIVLYPVLQVSLLNRFQNVSGGTSLTFKAEHALFDYGVSDGPGNHALPVAAAFFQFLMNLLRPNRQE